MCLRSRFLILLLGLVFSSGAALCAPASEPSPSHPAADATSRDDSRSAQMPAEAAETAPPDADAADASAASNETPSDTVPEKATGPLLSDGLLAQVFARFDAWFDGLSAQLNAAAAAVGDVGALGQWWHTAFDSPTERRQALHGLSMLLVIIGTGLLAEFLLHYLLRRPRYLVARQAAAKQAEAQARAARREADLRAVAAAAATSESVVDTQSPVDAPIAVARQTAGMGVPPAVERPDPTALPDTELARRQTLRNWGLLDRMPYAVADALLNLLPLVAFVGVIGLLMTWQRNATLHFQEAGLSVLSAYVGVRIALGVVRLMASPSGQGLRLFHMTDHSARYLYRSALALFAVSATGIALADITVILGAGQNVRVLVSKLTSLIVHLMLIFLVIRTRATARHWIRGQEDDQDADALRAFLAQVWPFAASLLIAAFWVVWALSVDNGFQRAVKFLALTAATLAVSRILWILVIGLLDRSFERANPRIEAVLTTGAEYYQTLLRRLINLLFAIGTTIVLFEVWGIRALDWFADGTIGRQVASAVGTIAVAGALALIAWETVSLLLRNRIQSWTSSGDLVRAARLRTLVPMIRTLVLIVIALIVIMTALNTLGINTAPMLAGASIIGVALGFGSQKLVQDFINGIFLLMENTMQVGDWVTVAGVSGTVEYLSIRTVRLRAADGSLNVVPFSSVSTVNNVNRGLGTVAIRINVTLDTDLDAAFDELRDIGAGMRADPTLAPLILNDLSVLGVEQINGSMATLAAQIRTTDKGRATVQREFNRRVLQRFKERGIKLAAP